MIRVFGHEIGEMAIIAPTGKASVRVTEATGLPARTIHSFIYLPKQDPLSGEIRYQRKGVDDIERPDSGLIVVEEASMVGLQVWEDIVDVAKNLDCHILCVGDSFQLPPVQTDSSEPFGLLLPDFTFDLQSDLTEITRQALESPIIRAGARLREGNVLDAVMELPRVSTDKMLEKHLEILPKNGVAICHRNSSRLELNRRIREHKKLSDRSLHDGEPLLVLRNSYQLQRFNGEVLRFDEWKRSPGQQWKVWDHWKQQETSSSFGVGLVEGQECSLSPQAVFGRCENVGIAALELVSNFKIGRDIPYLHCSFGYTLTAHKCQGSEYSDVLVVIERSVQPFTLEGRRWIYTAVTRAKENVSIVWQPKDEELGFTNPKRR